VEPGPYELGILHILDDHCVIHMFEGSFTILPP
jgi:hypothetical protein